jgi:hypothetical protein
VSERAERRTTRENRKRDGSADSSIHISTPENAIKLHELKASFRRGVTTIDVTIFSTQNVLWTYGRLFHNQKPA